MQAADLVPQPAVAIDGVEFHDIGFDRAVDFIVDSTVRRAGGVVCTPNVDYLVRARRDPSFRDALLACTLRLPDGMGIVYGSHLAGTPIRASITGRLLPQAVATRLASKSLSVALFGGAPGVAERAGRSLERAGGRVTMAFGPSMGFRIGSPEDTEAVARLATSGASVIFVALGAPKQESWMVRHREQLAPRVLVGVGAAFDVLAGRVREAPHWMTRFGLEWLFRLLQEPRRLARRYLWDDPRFFLWMLQWRRRRRRGIDARPRKTLGGNGGGL